MLTLGHFLIGQALETLPDSSLSYNSHDLRCWDLCQAIVQHFWKRWSTEYVTNLNRLIKWSKLALNLGPGDLVLLQEGSIVPTKWPLARVVNVHLWSGTNCHHKDQDWNLYKTSDEIAPTNGKRSC